MNAAEIRVGMRVRTWEHEYVQVKRRVEGTVLKQTGEWFKIRTANGIRGHQRCATEIDPLCTREQIEDAVYDAFSKTTLTAAESAVK